MARAAENDQYAHRCNIIMFGLEKLHKDVLIPRTHRLGQKTLNKNRPVVVKFRYCDVKWGVMKERKNLKGSVITFSEHLCLEQKQLQKDVSNHPGVQACRAWNGKVQAKDRDGNVKTVRYGTDCRKNSLSLTHLLLMKPLMAQIRHRWTDGMICTQSNDKCLRHNVIYDPFMSLGSEG